MLQLRRNPIFTSRIPAESTGRLSSLNYRRFFFSVHKIIRTARQGHLFAVILRFAAICITWLIIITVAAVLCAIAAALFAAVPLR